MAEITDYRGLLFLEWRYKLGTIFSRHVERTRTHGHEHFGTLPCYDIEDSSWKLFGTYDNMIPAVRGGNYFLCNSCLYLIFFVPTEKSSASHSPLSRRGSRVDYHSHETNSRSLSICSVPFVETPSQNLFNTKHSWRPNRKDKKTGSNLTSYL